MPLGMNRDIGTIAFRLSNKNNQKRKPSIVFCLL